MHAILDTIYTKWNNIGKRFGRNCISIKYNVQSQCLRIRCPRSWEDRSIKSLEMFMMAFEYAKPNIQNDFRCLINCEDFPEAIRSKQIILSYTKDSNSNTNKIEMVPDFCFLNWKESGMTDYDEVCSTLLKRSEEEPKYNTLFWIGNTKTHPTRKTLCALSEQDPRIEAYGMDWKYNDGRAIPSRFISLEDHTEYKYLIDVQGRGYSGRTKVLMFSGRPLFIADRRWKEFWYQDLVPFVHYIPVKEDLSDLIEKLDWAEANPESAKAIAINAQNYAKAHLTRKAALKKYTEIILQLANGR